MSANRRVIFEGAAGTGKTFLALEAAHRSAAAGQRVLFLCFNAMLGAWLRNQTQPLGPSVTTKTISSYMLQAAGVAPQPDVPAFWDGDLPLLALTRLMEDELLEPYDELIVDEAQDILKDAYLDVLDLSLRGGLAAGTWRLFGDFERQALFGTTPLDLETFCSGRAGSPARFHLTANCRNAPRIVELVKLLSRLGDSYTRVLRPDTGIEPQVRFAPSPEDQVRTLVEVLEDLHASGLAGEDIAVLSPRASTCTAERVTQSPWADRLVPARDAAASDIPYTTIHAFKGMEATAVIVTDIEDVEGAEAESLFYTALTRATDRLVLVVGETARASLLSVLANPQPELVS
jgi:superfamily I DNA/RNA helicase